MKNNSVIVPLSAFIVSVAGAHPPDLHDHSAPEPLWRSAITGRVAEGSFLASRGDDVIIETHDGRIASFAINELVMEDQARAHAHMAIAAAINASNLAPGGEGAPEQAKPFDFFKPNVKTRWDERWLYVESDGLPHDPAAHNMMKGIKRWQQQVPLPQPYTGDNAWRIPLKPVFADKPISAKTNLYRGAIALAANGVPIFNALNNRGDDTYKVGELDDFGGHSGRSDDYHYHIAPLVLQKVVGPENPIGYALDGFALYGYFTKGAKKGQDGWCPLGGTDALDEFNGHFGSNADGSKGTYHYHSSPEYPYINGGMKGKVEVVDDQIEPQPKARGVRQWLQALQGASITDFKEVKPQSWSLEYRISGAKYFVNYRIEGPKFIFDFVSPDGTTKTETYEARGSRGGGRGGEDRTAGESERGRGREGGREGGRNREGGGREDGGRSEGGNREAGGGREGNGGQGPKGPSPDGPRQPWIVAHASEIDVNKDGDLTREEVLDQAKAAFDGYDKDKSGLLEVAEYDRNAGARPVRSPMGGFIQLHAKELDSNGDGSIAREELMNETGRMFDKSDSNRDSKISKDEQSSTTRDAQPADGNRNRERGGGGGGGRGGEGNQGPGRGNPQEQGDGKSLRQRMEAFRTEVPNHPYNVIVTNIDTKKADVSILHHTDAEGYIEYGAVAGKYTGKSAPQQAKANEPFVISIPLVSSELFYRWTFKDRGSKEYVSTPEYRITAPRKPGAGFTFTIQADSHLDSNMDTSTYAKSLANALADRPDFHMDLGDTFMTDKRRDFHEALAQYDAQRYYFGLLCHSAPLYMILGNHDGEYGYNAGGADSMASWSYHNRTLRFPPPAIGGSDFYSGSTSEGSNYYSFTWGDARVIVLDPFWFTTTRERGGGAGRENGSTNNDSNWNRTLGKAQYNWLKTTLEGSSSKYTFVFIHHLVGGFGKDARGGVESSTFFEWGGNNADGTAGFESRRPGWGMPIHDLLVKHKVQAVFHGHDHLYVRNERDGVVYQCVPQPGNIAGGTRSASDYGYVGGKILGSPGYLRVRVSEDQATVEFVRTVAEGAATRRRETETNGTIVDSYNLKPR